MKNFKKSKTKTSKAKISKAKTSKANTSAGRVEKRKRSPSSLTVPAHQQLYIGVGVNTPCCTR